MRLADEREEDHGKHVLTRESLKRIADRKTALGVNDDPELIIRWGKLYWQGPLSEWNRLQSNHAGHGVFSREYLDSISPYPNLICND